MKPMLILPPGTMSLADMKLLRDNEVCVVVAKNPAAVKFVDPIPAVSSRTKIENAAIKLSRIMISGQWGNWNTSNQIGRQTACEIYMACLIEGTPLDPRGTYAEQDERLFKEEKQEELRRLAREEAKAERAAAKAKTIEAKKP